MGIETDVLRMIIPSNMEIKSIEDKARRLKSTVIDCVSRYKFDIKVMFTGSFSKGTFLQDTDLDLFLMFPKNVPRSELEKIGLEVGKSVLNGVHVFSEHPYTHGKFDGIDVDIVPCYILNSTKKLQSSVDRTPFHTYYIKSHLTCFQKNQVRLLKKFMKTIGTYGQDQYTRGFSGYLCELLIAYYGSFLDVLRGSQNWHNGTSIAIGNSGPDMSGTLIVYDPVDPCRNAASAVHLDTISRFIVASKAYISSPSMRFFFLMNREPVSKSDIHAILRNYGSKIISIIFKKPNIVDDNSWSQLWKTQYSIQKKLDELSFNVLRTTHNIKDNKLEIMFELQQDTLPNTYKHYGPPVWVESSRHFLDKWKGNTYGDPFIENGRWVIITKRTYCTAKEMLENEIKNLRIGKNLDSNSVVVYDHSETLEHEDPSMIMELLDPKMPWEY